MRRAAATAAVLSAFSFDITQEETFMPLPHNALVLVADGRKMLFFRNHGDENQIDLQDRSA